MKTRRNFLAVVGTTIAIGLSSALAFAGDHAHAHAHAKVGEAAPNFTLKDNAGTSFTLADYKGKIVVLQWINPKCPYCVRVTTAGPVDKMLKEIKSVDPDVVHLTINSTHWMEGSETAAYLKESKIDAPGLIDQDGKVGHIYGAKTTPHMYVIDKEGILRYQGAIDDDRRGDKGDEATNYVVNAVKQIAAGDTVTPDYAKPYGCGVKYKKKK